MTSAETGAAETDAEDDVDAEQNRYERKVAQKGSREGYGRCPEDNMGQEKEKGLQRLWQGSVSFTIPGPNPPFRGRDIYLSFSRYLSSN